MGVIKALFSIISGFFGSLGSKIAGLSLATISFLLFLLGRKNKKIENLEEENIMYQKKGHIVDEMNKVKAEEEKKADETIKDINTDNWRDRL